jgi:hypothetical protein
MHRMAWDGISFVKHRGWDHGLYGMRAANGLDWISVHYRYSSLRDLTSGDLNLFAEN